MKSPAQRICACSQAPPEVLVHHTISQVFPKVENDVAAQTLPAHTLPPRGQANPGGGRFAFSRLREPGGIAGQDMLAAMAGFIFVGTVIGLFTSPPRLLCAK